MNKTLNINLGGLIFHIDEDAYHTLERYLTTLKRQFSKAEGGEEIIRDIEVRIAELFRERTGKVKEVISSADVEEVIAIMGKPEDYLDPEEDTGSKSYEDTFYTPKKRIFRDPDDRILGGVASGLAAYFNIDPLWMRLLIIVLVFSGFGVLFYLVLWLVVPKANTTAEKLQMRGETVNISNIEKSIRDEMSGLGKNVKDFTRRASEYDYKRPTRQAGDFLREVADFVIRALKLILRFILKLIGFFFIFIGFIVLFALVAALFTGSFHLMGSNYGFSDLFEFISLVTVSSAHFNLVLIGTALLILAPLTLIIYLGVRIIFKLDRLGSPVRNGLILAAIVGFIMVLIAGIRIGVEFDDRSFYTTEKIIENPDDLMNLHIRKDEVYHLFEEDGFAAGWMQVENGNAFSKVYFDIEPSSDSIMRLKTKVMARGGNRRIARNNAESIVYEVEQPQSNELRFSSYYLLPDEVPFRDQEVFMVLYLPVGKSVYLGQDMVDIIYDIQNVGNMWDFDMIDHTWKMTDEGLECMDCRKTLEPEEPANPTQAPDPSHEPDTTEIEQMQALAAPTKTMYQSTLTGHRFYSIL